MTKNSPTMQCQYSQYNLVQLALWAPQPYNSTTIWAPQVQTQAAPQQYELHTVVSTRPSVVNSLAALVIIFTALATCVIRGGAKNAYVRIRSWHKSMSGSHVRISCRDQMCIFQLDFPCLLLSISQYLAICIYHCPFQFDFPFLLRSISQNWNSAFTNAFLGWIS